MSSLMYKKLSNTLINDKKVNTYEIAKVLKAEFLNVLENYGVVLPDSEISFEIDNSGNYNISFKAKVSRVKNFGFFN